MSKRITKNYENQSLVMKMRVNFFISSCIVMLLSEDISMCAEEERSMHDYSSRKNGIKLLHECVVSMMSSLILLTPSRLASIDL